MKNKDAIILIIKDLKSDIKKRYKVKELGLFGSVLRGELTEASDVDILVDFEEDADLFDLTGLGLFLEEKLGQRVDIVPKRSLRQEIKDAVLREAVSI